MESTQRLPDETDAQWLAYCCYRDLGIARTPRLAYEKYLGARGQSEAAKSNDRKISVAGSFAAWKNRFHWDERTREWDLGEELRQRSLQRSIDDQKYQGDLEQFRQSQMTSGRIGVKTAIAFLFSQAQYWPLSGGYGLPTCQDRSGFEGPKSVWSLCLRSSFPSCSPVHWMLTGHVHYICPSVHCTAIGRVEISQLARMFRLTRSVFDSRDPMSQYICSPLRTSVSQPSIRQVRSNESLG